MKPSVKPSNHNYSSGPCSKIPGFSLDLLKDAPLGRSHRSSLGKKKLSDAITRTKKILGLPDDYRVAIVPASDTGAFEMAMWSLLGPRGVDVFAWESFGSGWGTDIQKQLKISDCKIYTADYGKLPDLAQADFSRDVVFTWNGTTSGVKVPDGDWIPDNREGLTLCDATSAVFAMELPWKKLDVITYSWQKVLGGEAAHGMLILSPRAVARLESYTPAWPMPKIFRMTKGGKLNEELFQGSTINTPSMLCNEDYLVALDWVEKIGGTKTLMQRSAANLAVFEKFVKENSWIHFLAASPEIRSSTSICFTVDLEPDKVKAMVKLLADEGVAYDCGAYAEAPAGLRFWGGGTIETADVEKLVPWIKWAYEEVAKG